MNSKLPKLALFSLSIFFLFTLQSNAQISVDTLADGPANAVDCEIDAPPVGGNCSLRDAIEAANGNAGADEIIFDGTLVLPGTITLTDGFMTITDDLTINGPGASMLTIDADDLTRIFLVDDGSDTNVIVVEIIGLRFFDGFAQDAGAGGGDGGAIFNSENLTIESCDFDSNRANSAAGAIFNNQGDTLLNIRNSNFDQNEGNIDSFGVNGGAIANRSGNINMADGTINEIINSTFTNNSIRFSNLNDPNGGAIGNNGLIRDIIGCHFENNFADGFGGAIYSNSGEINNIIDTDFISNSARRSGGALNILIDVDLIDNCTFEDNSTFLDNGFNSGGAISFFGNDTISEIRNSTFNNNRSVRGGAISIGGSLSGNANLPQINNSTFSNNSADDSSVNTFPQSSSGSGGAIFFNDDTNTTNINNSTFTGNTATEDGGAIYVGTSTVDTVNISFSTIVGNNSGDRGGGLGGATSGADESYDIRNSIVANNSADDTGDNCEFVYVDVVPLDESNNFSNDTSCGFDNDSATINLGSLGDNGGPTQTIPLNGDVSVLDGASTDCDALNTFGGATGVAITTDQRLFSRPVGAGCDPGAFENGAAPETVTINLTKVTNPEGGLGFDFTSTNFGSLIGCMIDDTFTMDHNDTFTCDIPVGNYTIDEDIPGDQELQIVCNEGPANLVVNNMTGETTFTVIDPNNDDINCVYINSSPDFLSLVTPEPPGTNCGFGGVRVDTGFDDNFDGVLDPGEIDDTQFFCNTQAPPILIPVPTQGDDDDDGESILDLNPEPAGENCEFGGVRVDSGIDDNGDGVLQENEIDDTAFICNPAPEGEEQTPATTNSSSDSGCNNSIVGGTSDGMSVFSAFLPFVLIPFVLMYRRRNRSN